MEEQSLSFCTLIKHSQSLLEVVVNEGVNIEERHADEMNAYLAENFSEPFAVLSYLKNNYSFSFKGGLNIGNSPFQKKTALLIERERSEKSAQVLIELQRESHPNKHIRIFRIRAEALAWLEDL